MSAFTGTLEQTLTEATPLLLTALGENIVQKAGIVNVGLEGIMLCGALGATLVTLSSGNPYLGVALAAIVGVAVAATFAGFAIKLAANQVVVGVVINLLAIGLTGTVYQAQFGKTGALISTAQLPRLIWEQTLMLPFVLLAVPLVWWWLNRTRRGLELRACGEQPLAAEAAGIPVQRMRFFAVLFGGAMAGVGGAFLSVGGNNTFVPQMTDGRGFIALAIVTSGRWSPWGCLLAALIFGFADALQYQGQSLGLHIPKDLLIGLPYAATLLILLFGSRAGQAPAALGRPYRRA